MKKFKDSKAHKEEHLAFSRRGFLSTLGLASAGTMLLGNYGVTGLSASPLASVLNNANTDRVLVLIRLNGGNDGLNTIVPINQYDVYANARPMLKIPENNIIGLQDEFGIPDFMSNLSPFWNDGNMSVIHGVGYPNQDLSHFRSSDIWSSGSDADVVDSNGWMGKYLSNEFPDFLVNPPGNPPAVQIGGSKTFNALINDNTVDMGFSVSNPQQLEAIAENGQLYGLDNLPDCYYGSQLQYLRTVTNNTYIFSGAIYNAYNNSSNTANYGNGELSNQLALISRLIKGGLGTKIYMVNLRGFDTHDEQADVHQALLTELSNAVASFYNDLERQGSNVLSMVYSEFGRRIEENSSLGTDHGAAAPIMLFGGELSNLEQQSYGVQPDLNEPDEVGNLQFNVDFRSVYATVLESWLCVPNEVVNNVLGANFNRIENLLPNCNNNPQTSIDNPQKINALKHFVSGNNVPILHVELIDSGSIDIHIFNIVGKQVGSLFSGFLATGKHEFNFNPVTQNLPRGAYLYKIITPNEQVGGKLMNFGI